MNSIKFGSAFDVIAEDKVKASDFQTRADLMIALREIVEENKWKQNETAKRLNLTERQVRDLLNGKIEKFSTGILMAYFYRIGYRFKPVYQNKMLSMRVQKV